MIRDTRLEMKLVDCAKECLAEMKEPIPCVLSKRMKFPEIEKKDVTYGKNVCNVRPLKDEVNQSRLIVGEDRINFEGDCLTPTANLLTVKLLMNSIVSTPGACFGVWTLKIFISTCP